MKSFLNTSLLFLILFKIPGNIYSQTSLEEIITLEYTQHPG